MSITLRSASTSVATTKGAPLTYEELDANFTTLAAQDVADRASLAADTGASLVGFLQSGSGAIPLTVQNELRETISPLQFGGVGDGVTDDSAAILAASVAGVAQGKDVDFGGHTWLIGTQIALTSAHSGLKWRLRGATILKGFSGTLCTVTATTHFALTGTGIINGQQASYTGKGFVFSGAAHYPKIDCFFLNFPDAAVEFGADAGFMGSLCTSTFRNDTTEVCAVRVTGTDTTAMFRSFSNIKANGYVEITGGLDTQVNSAVVTRVVIDSTSSITEVIGTTMASGGTALTIDGSNTIVVGCRIAGDVTLSSTFTGVFDGNTQTAGTFTDNSVIGNALIFHKAPAASIFKLGRNSLPINTNTAAYIQTSFGVSAGNADYPYAAASGSAKNIRYATTLTADRATTLDDTASVGERVWVSRTGGGNFLVRVTRENGLLLAVLLQNNWASFEYDGSNWNLVGEGVLGGGTKALSSVTAVGNVGGGEDNLISLSMWQNGFGINNPFASRGVKITAWGTTANNSNPKTVKLYFGSAILTTALTVSQAGKWYIEAIVMSTGTDTQDYVSKLNEYGATAQTDMENGALTENDGAAITVKCTGTVTDGGGGINNDDIVQEGMVMELLS